MVEIGISTILTTGLFIALELGVILPLIRKIVLNVINDNLIPSLKSYVEEQKTALTETLTKSLLSKVRSMLGGRAKGRNAILRRLMDGEDIEDLEDDYSESVLSETLTNLIDVMPDLAKSIGDYYHGKKKDIKEEPQGDLSDFQLL